jgi:hypothetical protein
MIRETPLFPVPFLHQYVYESNGLAISRVSLASQGEYPDGVVYGCLDYAIHFLFDDTSLADEPEKLIGYILANQKEVELIRGVTAALDKLLFELGTDKSDTEYLSSPLWNEVVKASKKAYEGIKIFAKTPYYYKPK